MGFQVEDGKGRGYRGAITMQNKTLVEGTETGRAAARSLDGFCFNLVSVDAAAAAADYIAYLQNDSSDKALVVDFARVGAANAALWKFTVVTGTAAGGSALTPANLNLESGTVATVTARGDGAVTGLTAGAVFATARNVAGGSADINFDDTVILRENDAIGVEYDTGTGGAAEVLIRFYLLDLDEVV